MASMIFALFCAILSGYVLIAQPIEWLVDFVLEHGVPTPPPSNQHNVMEIQVVKLLLQTLP